MKKGNAGTKKKLQTVVMAGMFLLLLTACTEISEDKSVTEEAETALTEVLFLLISIAVNIMCCVIQCF